MTIHKKESMHGAGLVAVADAEGFTALNKAADRYYGHYIVNADRHIFIKYTLGDGPEFTSPSATATSWNSARSPGRPLTSSPSSSATMSP